MPYLKKGERTMLLRDSALWVACLVGALAGVAHAGDLETDGAFISTKTGGPPVVVSSTDVAPGLNVDALDGVGSPGLPRSAANIVTVGTGGANFSSVETAVDSLSDASATNPYLVVIGPGVFDSGAELVLPGHIHLWGAGAESTTLAATLRIEGPTSIRSLRVDGSDLLGLTAIDVASGVSVRIDHVRVTTDKIGIKCAHGSQVHVADTEIQVGFFAESTQLWGVLARGAAVELRDVSIIVNGGTVFASNRARGLEINSSEGIAPVLEAVSSSIRVVGGSESVRALALSGTDPEVPVRIVDSTIELVDAHSPDPAAVRFDREVSAELLRTSVEVTGSGPGIRLEANQFMNALKEGEN